jgi:predicted MFS family arabinose efflux permease
MEKRSLVPLIILSGLIVSICMGLRQSLGLFMRPMGAELGITAAAFSFSIALQNIVWGFAQPFAGAIADRRGPRPVIVATALVFAGGLLLFMMPNVIPGGLALAGFMLGVGTTGFSTLYGAINRRADPLKRSQTVGLVAACGSLGTMVIAPLGGALIAGPGWHTGLVVFAALGATMALLALPISEKPELNNLKKTNLRDALREALGHRGYLFMTLAFFACGFQLVFLTTHLPSYLALCGVSPDVGAKALGLIGLFNAIGTFIFGQLGARYSQKHLLALIYLLRTTFIAAFLIMPVSAASTLIFASAMGFLWLGVTPLVNGILARVFGLQHFNALFGVVFLSHQVGSFFGAWMGGLVFDRWGNYNFAWGALIVIGVAAFTLQWLMDEKPPTGRAVALAGT